MCLTIPAKVISVDANNKATVVFGNEKIRPRRIRPGRTKVDTQLAKVKINDYVMVSNGFVVKKINKNEAEEMLKVLKLT